MWPQEWGTRGGGQGAQVWSLPCESLAVILGNPTWARMKTLPFLGRVSSH